MTKPLDPSVLAMIVAATEAAVAASEKKRQAATGGHGVKDMPFREVWAEFARNVLSIAPGTKGARRDLTTIWSHEPVLLGDPMLDADGKPVWPGVQFEWDGQMVRLGDVPSLSITAELVARFRQALVNVPRRDGKPGATGPGYRNRVITSLMAVLSWKWGKGKHALTSVKKEDTKERRREGYLTDEQVETLCRVGHADLADLIHVGMDFGCLRRGEVTMLQVQHVNWDTGYVTLPGYMVKNGESRTFPVSDATMAILRRRKEAGRRGNTYLFQDPRASVGGVCECEVRLRYPHEPGHLGLWKLNDMMRRAAVRGGVFVGEGEKKRLAIYHDIRRKGATDIIKATNGNLEALMACGGWNSVNVARGYIQRDKEAMAKFRELTNRDAQAARQEAAKPPEAPQAPTSRKPPIRRVPAARKPLASAGRGRRRGK